MPNLARESQYFSSLGTLKIFGKIRYFPQFSTYRQFFPDCAGTIAPGDIGFAPIDSWVPGGKNDTRIISLGCILPEIEHL